MTLSVSDRYHGSGPPDKIRYPGSGRRYGPFLIEAAVPRCRVPVGCICREATEEAGVQYSDGLALSGTGLRREAMTTDQATGVTQYSNSGSKRSGTGGITV